MEIVIADDAQQNWCPHLDFKMWALARAARTVPPLTVVILSEADHSIIVSCAVEGPRGNSYHPDLSHPSAEKLTGHLRGRIQLYRNKRAQARPPSCRRPEQSPKDGATESLLFLSESRTNSLASKLTSTKTSANSHVKSRAHQNPPRKTPQPTQNKPPTHSKINPPKLKFSFRHVGRIKGR